MTVLTVLTPAGNLLLPLVHDEIFALGLALLERIEQAETKKQASYVASSRKIAHRGLKQPRNALSRNKVYIKDVSSSKALHSSKIGKTNEWHARQTSSQAT